MTSPLTQITAQIAETMICAGIERQPQDKMYLLEQYAANEDGESPLSMQRRLAQFLLGKIPADLSLHTDIPNENLQEIDRVWQLLLKKCREISLRGHAESLEELLIRARIGQWPTELPKVYEPATLIPFKWDGYRSDIWIPAWLAEQDTLWGFINKGSLPHFLPAHHERGHTLAQALRDIITYGIVEIPNDRNLPFLAAYARWITNSRASNADADAMARTLKVVWGNLSNEELQGLAALNLFFANYELGSRGFFLAAPLAQNKLSWMAGVGQRVKGTYLGLGAAVERFRTNNNPFERYWLYQQFERSTEGDPQDPFGEVVSSFWLALGRPEAGWEPAMPTYEETVEYLKAKAKQE